jgi:hypothetical protein
METLLAFLWAPLVLYGLAVGIALLAERVLKVDLPNPLLGPVGLGLIVALVMPVYRLGGDSTAALALALPCALAGGVLARAGLPGRLNPGAAALSGVSVYALYMAPVVLSGHWTWAGYNFVNDTSANLLFADLLSEHGLSAPAAAVSSTASIQSTPSRFGYPVGAHGVLATLRPLAGAPLAAIYQPVIAATAGLAAMAMAELARGAGLRTRTAALAGALSMGAVLIYRYALHGSIKEVLVVALVATCAALARVALDRELNVRMVVLIALCAAALLHVFGAVGGVYAVALGVLLLAVGLLEGRSVAAVGRLALVGAAISLVAIAGSLSDVKNFAERAGDAFASEGGASTAYMGHLLRPIPLVQTAGVWLARDYRGPVQPHNAVENSALLIVVGLLLAVGIAWELRRRRPSGLLLLVPAAAVAAALVPRLSPYAGAKLLVIMSPAVCLMAAIGALSLLDGTRRLARGLGAAGLAALTIGLVLSDGLGYREVTLAPPERVEAMQDVAAKARGPGLWLVNEWEEYAKFFMRDIRVNAAFEAESPIPAQMREPRPIFGRYYDLDELTLEYVQSFPGLIKRRSPSASRPPGSFDLVYRNDYYEAWRRRASSRVLEHLPLQSLHAATSRPSCGEVRRLAARARGSDRLIAAARPALVLLNAVPDEVTWARNPNTPGTVVPISPGRAEGTRGTRGGRFRVWIRGSFGRRTWALVDGRKVGAAHEVNTPGQWVEVGSVALAAGRHRLAIERPGLGLRPGDGFRGEMGPLALEPVRGGRLVRLAPERYRELCRGEWDWIELVRG